VAGIRVQDSRSTKPRFRNANLLITRTLILTLLGFLAGNSSLEPLLEGLLAQIHIDFS